MSNLTEIYPLKGLGEISFGFTRNQVKSILGEPSEIDTFQYDDDDDDELTESWHYDEKEISLSFDEVEDWKLVNIAISSDNFTLNSKTIIGLKKNELKELLTSLDLGTVNDDVENNVVSIIEKQLNFWFDEGEVAEIQWNVDWNEEGEAIFPL